VKWTPGVLALVTAACFVTLVAVGVGYVVHSDPDQAALVRTEPESTPASPTQTSAVPTPAVLPAPGRAVTLTAKPSPTVKPKPKPKRKKAKPSAAPEPPPVLDFTISSFNMLGSSHTSGAGKRPGMASGRVRAGRAAALVRRHGSEVVGFQELQRDQLVVMSRNTSMDFFPGFAGRARDSENSIGWRRDAFVAVEKHTVNIPYFNGHPRAMPYVKLRSLSTGLEAWFANFHNPAETRQYHHQQRWRDRATGVEIALANRLINETGLPVFITGDMNERDSYFCRMTGGAPMVAARGGSHNGGCQPGNPRAVDWIFGSQGVTFSGYFEDRSRLVDRTTDHPVVVSQVRIVGEASDPADDGDS
jgi:Endonuclease/Exonuclease/phosphatase family